MVRRVLCGGGIGLRFLMPVAAQDLPVTVDEVLREHVGVPTRETGVGAPWGKHEGGLHGVPGGYDWAEGARPGVWLNLGNNEAVTSWGQVYEWSGESPVTDVRIQIRRQRMWGYAEGQWVELESTTNNIQASYFAEDFSSSAGSAAGRDESANGGGKSFAMPPGHNLHWWDGSQWPRAAVPAGVQALFLRCELRLIPGDTPGVDLAAARYLAGVSMDAYPTTTSAGPGPWPSLSITRHRFLTEEWQVFSSYITASAPVSVQGYRDDVLSLPLPPTVFASAFALWLSEHEDPGQPGTVRLEDGRNYPAEDVYAWGVDSSSGGPLRAVDAAGDGPGGFRFSFHAVSGVSYRVMRNSDLTDPLGWAELGGYGHVSGAGAVVTVTDAAPPERCAYRIEVITP